MVNWQHESLFPRCTATSAADHRPGKEPGPGRRNICHFHRHHQAVSQSPPRERTRFAQSHSRTSQRQRGSLTGRSVRAVESPPRCHPRATLPDMGSHPRHQGESSQHHACQAGLGLDAKKKTLRASEQKEAERAAWRTQEASLPSQELIFVDETGSHIAMTPLYAYAPRGERAVGKVPRNYGAIMRLLASMSLTGMGPALVLDGAADSAAFAIYVEQILAPSLRPGQIVILDNLSIHLGSRVKHAIEARGCRLLFLPAYSPDWSPSEEAFSKLKTLLRRAGARTREALQEAIATALDLITATDALGWFTHCGYPPSSSTEKVQELCTPL
jgi:transposase